MAKKCTRRDFLKRTGTALAGAYILGSSYDATNDKQGDNRMKNRNLQTNPEIPIQGNELIVVPDPHVAKIWDDIDPIVRGHVDYLNPNRIRVWTEKAVIPSFAWVNLRI